MDISKNAIRLASLMFSLYLLLANPYKIMAFTGSVISDLDADGLEDTFEATIGTNPKAIDTDGDGLYDYDEICKYRTNPLKKDSDDDGIPDRDWNERREYTYTIRALCEIRSPCNVEMLNDTYQEARVVSKNKDTTIVEVILYPFATPHVYSQPYPKVTVDNLLKKYTQSTVSMNFSPEMKKEVGLIVKDANTDVEAIEKMLDWIKNETKLITYNPHWDYFNIIDNKIVWHKSLGDANEDEQFLQMNFFGDSMFKKKVHGTCSSMAILRGAMFRAAGLPTRLIQTLPLITRYTEDIEPLADRLRNRAMANGYNWGPGNGGANHMYNEVFLNNHWIRVDDSINVGPFVGDKLFVKVYSIIDWNNFTEEWNGKRCFRALDVSDAYQKYKSGSEKVDIAIEDKDLTVKKTSDGQFQATIAIRNKGNIPTPSFQVYFSVDNTDSNMKGYYYSSQNAGPIMPNRIWKEATREFDLKYGENIITVDVDPGNLVNESNETNNRALKIVKVDAKTNTVHSIDSGNADSNDFATVSQCKIVNVQGIDLSVTDNDLVVRKLPDGSVSIFVGIRNTGNVPSPQFCVCFYTGNPDKGGRKLGRDHYAGPINPGEVWREGGDYFLTENEHQIVVIVDPNNDIKEIDKTNNRASSHKFSSE